MIRTAALLSVFCLPVLAATVPAEAHALATAPATTQAATSQALVHFDTPGNQTAEVTTVAYHRYYHPRHRRYHRR